MLSTISVTAQLQIGTDIDGEAVGDKSGRSVCMPDAYTVAIGAPLNDGNGTNAGHVRVYKWNGNAWLQKGSDIDGEAAGDLSGTSVSMPDSNTLAIGAPENDGGIWGYSGHVRIYRWNGTTWIQKGGDIDGELVGDLSGWSISMPDSNTVAIGATDNDGNGNLSGHVRVYRWIDTAWVQRGSDIDGEAVDDESGYSVSMPDSNTVAIGAPYNGGNQSKKGHVRVYRWIDTAWVQIGSDIDGEASEDISGGSVSMPDSNTLAIGAYGNDDNGSSSGHVRIYQWKGNAWIQKGSDINGEAAIDFSGRSVSMPDSNTVAISAPYNDGNGSASGHLRVYKWNGNNWIQVGNDIDGEAAGDHLGTSPNSIWMPDANTIAAGAINNDGNSSNSGHVRVYSLCNSDSTITITACNSYTSPSRDSIWTSSGTYTDVIPNAGGCDSIITINLTINPLDTSVTLSNDTLRANATNASYQWVNCDNGYAPVFGAANRRFLPPDNDNYAVIITKNGCSDTSSCYYVIVSALSKQKTKQEQFAVYPNPTNGVFTIENNAAFNNSPFEIRDITGKVVHKGKLNGNRTLVDLSKFSSGIYLLRVDDRNIKVIRK
ncbi:MAG: T9SS type A sorting domain-containing protein [Vicingaceae bacterium]